MARIVVSGYMIRHPLAGNQLAFFQYLLGLSRLGHDVVYVEESGWPDACYDPRTASYSSDPAPGIRAAKSMCSAFGVDCPVYYVDRDSGRALGTTRAALEKILAASDLWLNVGGVCRLPEFELCPRRALVDMDPLFTQIGHFGGDELGFFDTHFTYGTNIGSASCTVPTAGVRWQPLLPPVVPEIWSEPGATGVARNRHRPLTSIANWRAYGDVEWNGHRYGQKNREFERLKNLPSRCRWQFVLALSGESDEIRTEFRQLGWSIISATDISLKPDRYIDFIRTSAGEFSTAKHAYVATRSGWFSDRSVCYLAAGLPVIVQDTGIADSIAVGKGILVFSDPDQAAAAADALLTDYRSHCGWALDFAREKFSYRVVLPRMLEIALSKDCKAPPDDRQAARKCGDKISPECPDTGLRNSV